MFRRLVVVNAKIFNKFILILTHYSLFVPFISTLKAYFLGKKHLFEGLAIAELEKDWIEYPVIYIDFNMGSVDCLKTVKITLNTILSDYERQWGIIRRQIKN